MQGYKEIKKFCNKCGKIWNGNLYNETETCDICQNTLKIIPDEYFAEEYLDKDGYSYKWLIEDDMREKLIEELVKPSPNFDQWYFDNRDRIYEEQDAAYYASKAYAESLINGTNKGNSYGVRCPYCNATNVRRISGLSKAGSAALFGVFAMGKASKRWHCSHCGSDF